MRKFDHVQAAFVLVVAAPMALMSGAFAETGSPSFGDYFPKTVVVFEISVHATKASPDQDVIHAAGVLAQYLDNNGDGEPDDSRLVETLIERDGRLFMAVDRDELDRIFEELEASQPGMLAKTAWWVNSEGITEPDWIWQNLQSDETIAGGGREADFDGALEEVLHLVSHVGLANAYPEAFREVPGSRLGDAMDTARGGRFLRVPERYPANASYTYHDPTCVYQCQATEYFYWSLTSKLGAQSDPARLTEIEKEWRLNTAQKLRRGDPEIYDLLDDPEYRLPKILPDGAYTGSRLVID